MREDRDILRDFFGLVGRWIFKLFKGLYNIMMNIAYWFVEWIEDLRKDYEK